MNTFDQIDHAKRQTPMKGFIAGLRRVYRAVRRPHRAWHFISDHERYVADRERRVLLRERHRVNAEEWARKEEFFRRAFRLLAINGISGDYVEFGVGWGHCFTRAYHCACRSEHPARLWAFDSFEGMPASDDPRDSHPDWLAGNFATSLDRFLDRCKRGGVPRGRFEVVPGFFRDSLAPSSPGYHRLPEDIAFAYVAGATYTSAKSVLNFLSPRLKHGMILAFDTYFCVPSKALAGERLAFLELQREVPQFNFLPYIQFGRSGISFIVESQSLLLV